MAKRKFGSFNKFPSEILLKLHHIVSMELINGGFKQIAEQFRDFKARKGAEIWENVLYLGHLEPEDMILALRNNGVEWQKNLEKFLTIK